MPRTLMPHQLKAVEWAVRMDSPALFLEMRLGKTLVAIRWVLERGFQRVLVVCPLPVLQVWAEELALEGETAVMRLTRAKTRVADARDPSSRWFVVNYEGLRTCEPLAQLPWDAVILDESTRIRNPKAQITKLLTRKLQHVKHRAVLSGLPAPESALDYFTQFQFLHGQFMGCYNFWQFRQKHFMSDAMGWTWTATPKTLAAIKEEVHRKAFVMTRHTAGIGSKKVYEKRVVSMSPEQLREYNRVHTDFAAKFSDGKIRLTPWVVVRMQWLSRIAGGFHPDGPMLSDSKIRELVSLLKDELRDEQVVVWFRYNAELHTALDRLSANKISCAGITGQTKSRQRQEIMDAFRFNDVRVLLLQVKVGKFGLNLSTASTAIYFSNSYDMEDRAQSEERILDPRKTEPLLYIDLLTEDSVDQEVYQILREKKVSSKFFMAELIRKWRERQ